MSVKPHSEIMEAVASILSGIGTVPPREAERMANRAAVEADRIASAKDAEIARLRNKVHEYENQLLGDDGKPFEDTIRRNVPLGRPGTGEDIAHMVIHLSSDAGAWVTGQSYNVDGGQVVAH